MTQREWLDLADKAGRTYDQQVKSVNQDPTLRDFALLASNTFFLISAVVDSGLKSTKNEHNRSVFHYLLTKGMKSYRSIDVLCLMGNDQDAMALLRTLVDTVITLRYMVVEDTDNRVRRFMDYEAVEQRKRVQTYQNMLKEGCITPEEFKLAFPDADEPQRIETKFAAFVAKYLVGKSSDRSWSGKDTLGMAKAPLVGMVSDYLKAFKSFSLYTHPTGLAMKAYVQQNLLSWSPSSSQATNSYLISTHYLLELFDNYCEALGTPIPSEVKDQITINTLIRLQRVGYQSNLVKSEIGLGQWAIL